MKNTLIIGDGIIGMLSAIVLSSIYKNIYLVKSSKKKHYTSKIDRFFSINLLSQYFFMKNNIWEDIITSNPRSYNKIITWDDKIEDSLLFESSSISYDSLGYIVKETSIINSLLKRLANIKNVMSIKDTDIKEIRDNDGTHTMILLNGESIDLDLILKSDKSMDILLSSDSFKSNTVDPYLLQLIKNFNKKEVPIMPFKANFLMEKYHIPEGKELGGKLKLIEETWCDNNFQISDAEVQKIINN